MDFVSALDKEINLTKLIELFYARMTTVVDTFTSCRFIMPVLFLKKEEFWALKNTFKKGPVLFISQHTCVTV